MPKPEIIFENEAWVTADEAARLMGVSRRSIYNYAKDNKIIMRKITVFGSPRILKSSLYKKHERT